MQDEDGSTTSCSSATTLSIQREACYLDDSIRKLDSELFMEIGLGCSASQQDMQSTEESDCFSELQVLSNASTSYRQSEDRHNSEKGVRVVFDSKEESASLLAPGVALTRENSSSRNLLKERISGGSPTVMNGIFRSPGSTFNSTSNAFETASTHVRNAGRDAFSLSCSHVIIVIVIVIVIVS
ncbi:hypothetical protein F1559_001766 [Cyanidiococcus yangmingshanensis]|uniref:Uncharacterized protein n=1 Tax=Cyanidiococcus yangmingshanensis TaxID=2690220 RepID=A0A7J7IC76_9RHOD|nr:hypothetical protein F1559_001766 [Cyanidiococcus yangmingshanensis]